MFKRKKKILDLNNPKDAREFLIKALPEALPSKPTHVILNDGTKLDFKDMNDSQVVQYAWETLTIFQAAFPENVDLQYEH